MGRALIPLIIINWLIYFWARKKLNKKISVWGDFKTFEGIILKIFTVITIADILFIFFIVICVLWTNYISTISPQV